MAWDLDVTIDRSPIPGRRGAVNPDILQRRERVVFSLTAARGSRSPNTGDLRNAGLDRNWENPPRLTIVNSSNGDTQEQRALMRNPLRFAARTLDSVGTFRIHVVGTSERVLGPPTRSGRERSGEPIFPDVDLRKELVVQDSREDDTAALRSVAGRASPSARRHQALQRQVQHESRLSRQREEQLQDALIRSAIRQRGLARPGLLRFDVKNENATNAMSLGEFERYLVEFDIATRATPLLDLRPNTRRFRELNSLARIHWHVRESSDRLRIYATATPLNRAVYLPQNARQLERWQRNFTASNTHNFRLTDWLVVKRGDSNQRILLSADQLSRLDSIESLFQIAEAVLVFSDIFAVIVTLGAAGPAIAARRGILTAIRLAAERGIAQVARGVIRRVGRRALARIQRREAQALVSQQTGLPSNLASLIDDIAEGAAELAVRDHQFLNWVRNGRMAPAGTRFHRHVETALERMKSQGQIPQNFRIEAERRIAHPSGRGNFELDLLVRDSRGAIHLIEFKPHIVTALDAGTQAAWYSRAILNEFGRLPDTVQSRHWVEYLLRHLERPNPDVASAAIDREIARGIRESIAGQDNVRRFGSTAARMVDDATLTP